MTHEYNASSISSLSDLEHIIHRTSAYIPDKGLQGQITICREIIDNAIDELSLKINDSGKLDIAMFINRANNSYTMIVRDNGRGIPVGDTLINSFASARTSGKFDTSAGYTAAAGLFGLGSTVTLALSSWFRVISQNKDIIGDVTLHRDNIPEHISTIKNNKGTTGTIVMFSPDTELFVEFDEYISSYGNLIERLSQLSLFSSFEINFFVIEKDIDASLAKYGDIETTLNYVDSVMSTSNLIFTNRKFDRDAYIRHYFNMTKKWDGRYEINGISKDGKLSIDGEIFVQLKNVLSGINKITFVNTILFNDNSSLHISLLFKFLKDRLVNHLSDKSVKTFFIEHYKLPLWLVLNVKFSNAQFSGYAKTAFKDLEIKKPYIELLNSAISDQFISSLYDLLNEHISIAYNKFTNSDFKVGNMKNLNSRLNRPEKFNNCSTTDRETAELFLVEGDSAKSDQDRNSLFQANYTLGGKPYNGLTTVDKLSVSSNNIKKNQIFQDIIMLMNITPGSSDLSSLNFGKLIIMADADTHGYHITNIIIGNLLALCPALITEGRVYVTIPPLYRLSIKGGQSIYVRNTSELNTTLAYHLYYKCIDIALVSDKYNDYLGQEEYVIFADIILTIGDEISRLSREYMIPPNLLEKLSLLTAYLDVDNPNIAVLQENLGVVKDYDKMSKILIISIGKEDIVVPLTQITDLIYDRLLPLYKKFYYGKTRIKINTKLSDVYKDTFVSIYQLYEIFKQLNSMFKIARFKGLGKMNDHDRARTCTNPETRRIFQITSIGSVDEIFNMMGSDSTHRKNLVI